MPAPTTAFTFIMQSTDPVLVASLQAQYPQGVQMSPVNAAALFGFPIGGQTPGGALTYPALISFWPTVGPAQTGVASGIIPGTGWTDQFGNVYPDNGFYWVGYFLLVGPALVAPAVPPPIGVRRFAIGFETPLKGEYDLSAMKPARASSRSLDGYGYAYRATGQNDGSLLSMPAPNPIASCERLYVRIRQRPTASNDMIWCVVGSNDGSRSMLHIDVTPAGALVLYNQGSQAFPGTLLVTSGVLTLDTWYRIDVQFSISTNIGPPFPDGLVTLYLNGTSLGTIHVVHGTTGLGSAQTHTNSGIGNNLGDVATHGLEADIDDWIDSDAIDVTSGSHCQLIRATGFAPGHDPTWIGDWRALLAQVAESSIAADCVTTQTASAQMEITTDAQPSMGNVASISLSVFDRAVTGGGNGQLGYRGPGGVTMLQVVVLGAGAWSRALFTAGGSVPIDLGNFNIVFIKDPSGAAGNIYGASSLMGSVEFLGVFGPEDVPATSTIVALSPTRGGIHNSPYPTSAYALSPFAPTAPVGIYSGTYVGDSFGHDVVSKVPAHWWWVRAVGGNADGVWWWSTMDTAHGYANELMTPDRMYQALLTDPTTLMNGTMRLAGANAQANQAGVTYQWVAVSDPGSRFMLNGAFRHPTSLASIANNLVDAAFTPEAAFFYVEAPSTSAGTNSWFKGIGHTVNSASPVDGAVNNTVAALGAGVVTSKAAIHNVQGTQPQTAFSCWRRVDSHGLSGVLDLVTYVGDGVAGTRNIPAFPTVPNTIPFFAIVTPHNGASYFRDPSHVGTACHLIGTGNVANNGIVGFAANQVQVGITLNALGVVYDIFVLPGGPLGATNPNAPFFPVSPFFPGFGPPPPAQGLTPIPPPTPTPTPGPSRGACYPLSQAIADIALRLGDPGNVHWTAAELTRYIQEALRTYNAFTSNYRNRASFNATVFQPFYDLPTVIPSLRAYNIHDRDLVTDIEYALMEPPTPTVWTGTVQFDLTTVAACLQRRRDQFLKETGIVLTREVTSLTAPVSGRIPLPIDVLTVRRAAWATPAGVVTPLRRDDEWALTNYLPAWPTGPNDPASVFPTVYSAGVTPPLTLQMGPVPLSAGFLDILAVVLGAAFTPAVSTTFVGVPDDWAWVIKWGALADLLSQDGLGNDPLRSAYCEARFEHGVALATKAPVVLAGQITDAPQRLYSVNDGDSYLRGWQTTPGTPTKLFTAGHNVLAVATPPDPNNGGPPYAITLDVVANMPVPVNLNDCVNVGVDLAVLDILYDYVEHLALFKEGPGELDAAMALYNRFMRECGVTVGLDYATTPDRDAIMGQTTQDDKVHPRILPPTSPTT